jgi:hypothetical protein
MSSWFSEKVIEEKKEPVITEMCDVCCKDGIAPIPRYKFISSKGTSYVIRCHPQCDPLDLIKRLELC